MDICENGQNCIGNEEERYHPQQSLNSDLYKRAFTRNRFLEYTLYSKVKNLKKFQIGWLLVVVNKIKISGQLWLLVMNQLENGKPDLCQIYQTVLAASQYVNAVNGQDVPLYTRVEKLRKGISIIYKVE